MEKWKLFTIILSLLILPAGQASAGKVHMPMDGSGTTIGSYNNLVVEGWSYFDSRGTMDTTDAIELNFTITHETTKPEKYKGIIVMKGVLLRSGKTETGTFEIKTCSVTWGYDMCSWFGAGREPREIKTHGDVSMNFVLENENPQSTTLFKLQYGCMSCPLYPIPTPPGENKNLSKKKCFKTNGRGCPEGTEAYFAK